MCGSSSSFVTCLGLVVGGLVGGFDCDVPGFAIRPDNAVSEFAGEILVVVGIDARARYYELAVINLRDAKASEGGGLADAHAGV